jgi:predicted negative regulator of RcsB-dependent stress response
MLLDDNEDIRNVLSKDIIFQVALIAAEIILFSLALGVLAYFGWKYYISMDADKVEMSSSKSPASALAPESHHMKRE